jgi:8-oxo-dGTP pyrophosphatase MutT (NUDIX family)
MVTLWWYGCADDPRADRRMPTPSSRTLWPALDAARASDVQRRVPFAIDVDGAPLAAGSVAHLPALAPHTGALAVSNDGVRLTVGAAERSAALAEINAQLRTAGLVVGWRDETYPIVTRFGAPPLALIERAAARFWGTLCFAAHCNGYVADDDSGRPSHLWIARRSRDKSVDPGLLDNLIGGGVAHGQTPFETLLREGMEEAGLPPALVERSHAGSLIELRRDVPEGLQHDQLFVYDLEMPRDLRPHNHDGEVAEFHCLPLTQVLALAAGPDMAVDASMVTLDFALRHRLLSAAAHAELAPAFGALTVVLR